MKATLKKIACICAAVAALAGVCFCVYKFVLKKK